ncbi:MAG: PAS domain S-box protein [Candidatus Omnitrophica bacterium]|nr:PAS domain S-box protein [Candidatus Omnitrophota bacterium]
MPVACVVVDRSRHIQAMNAAAEQFFAGRKDAAAEAEFTFGRAFLCHIALNSSYACGFDQACRACPVRRMIEEAYEKASSFSRVPVELRRAGQEEKDYLASAYAQQLGKEKYVILWLEHTFKAIEKVIQEREAVLRGLLNANPESVFLMDRDGIILAVNETTARRLGVAAVQMVGTSAYKYLPSDIAESRKKQVHEAVSAKRAVQFEDMRSGIYMDHRIVPMMNAEGAVTSLAVLGIDITERKRIEDALLESVQFNKQIIQNAEDGIVVYDSDLKYLVWNPAMEKISGVVASDVLGKYPLDIFPFLQETGVFSGLQKTLKGDPQEPVEFPLFRKHRGKTIWVSDARAPLKNTQGGIIGVIGVVRDITERKEAEMRLRESEERVRSIVDNAPDFILTTDQDGKVLSVNRNLSQYSCAQILGKKFSELIYPADRVLVRAAMQQAFQEQSAGCEVRAKPRGKNIFWYSIRIGSIRIEQVVIGTTMIMKDITERKHSEMKLQEQQQALESASRKLKMFSQELLAIREEEKKRIAIDLHDETGSMAVALSAGLSMIENDVKSQDQQGALKNIHKTKTMLKSNVAVLKRIAEDLRPPNLDIVGLTGVLRAYFSAINERGELVIRFSVRGREKELQEDVAIALYRITQEVITNVIKHAHAGNVSVELDHRQGGLKYVFSDDGQGFDPQRIAHGSRRLKLGLQGIKERVEALKGTLIIESVRRKGTTLKVVLPPPRRNAKAGRFRL